MKRPSYFIQTYGCQMNTNDSERLSGLLKSIGLDESLVEKEANLIIFNTCSVRAHAEERIYGRMEELMERKKKGEDVLITVTGCMAGRDKTGELRRRLGMADLFFATPDMVNLPRWIAELRPEWIISGDVAEDYLKINPLRQKAYQAYVTIQTGCNHFCTYCVVPYARGLERNRPVADVLDEINDLVSKGRIDITLLGQAVNDYKAPDPGTFTAHNPYKNHFAALLWEINQIEGVKRLHWTAAHPMSMEDEIIHALTLPKQVNYLHLPVQAGSNEVLRRMNRKYTREDYLEVINKVKATRPGIALGTDIIVGFCGETEKDFEDTISLYKESDFDISYTAQYSPRTGTLGYRLFKDDVPDEEKKRRWQVLQDLMEQNALRKNQDFCGKVLQVFIEKVDGDIAYGTSQELKSVRATGAKDWMVGKIMPASIEKAMTWQLEGQIVL
ncbi:MAG: tRNA (N6-isopentenyl adenosine(37)-C2)-methylthiotransferase MiaB [Patescibacteria group bacterium]|nr:tRNA (N6-isopentenyl adenosine(37)-C2)-methylthiotransferase MiaB [Patescibacteria group bacterium]